MVNLAYEISTQCVRKKRGEKVFIDKMMIKLIDRKNVDE